MSAAAIPALETRGLRKAFGGLCVTNDVSFTLGRGARHALIGPNGAGKTSFVNLLFGVLRPCAGTILLNGHDVTSASPARRARLGLGRSFQINQLFPSLTPAEALALAAGHGGDAATLAARFHLSDVLHRPTAELAYGKQRLLDIALAMAGAPRVLILDEPAAGIPEGERAEILAALAALPADVAVLLIEHDMDLVFAFASRITVLVDGAIMAEGTPGEIAADPMVQQVYLGAPGHD